jgi:hypothetical protein
MTLALRSPSKNQDREFPQGRPLPIVLLWDRPPEAPNRNWLSRLSNAIADICSDRSPGSATAGRPAR